MITAVCALAGAGMLAGKVWAQGPEPLDLGPAIVVQPSGLPMPEATARSQPPSPMTPSLPEKKPPPPTKSAPLPQTSTPQPQFTPPSPQQSGGRPVEILDPPRSSESGTPGPEARRRRATTTRRRTMRTGAEAGAASPKTAALKETTK